ncbi:MAG: fibronectin type III domain-containing protein [Gammaproteobacteria bacterium]
MKRVVFIHQYKIYSVVKLLISVIITSQLVACGGGGSSKTSTEKIPDAYRLGTVSSNSTTLEAAGKADVGKTGVLELSWSAPSTRTDGEPLSLSEIDGYRIYYGKQKGEYVKGADIKDGAAQSVTVTGVPVGEYYVVMTTYDANGIESDYSQSVIKTVI